MKRPRLEVASWIAGIASAILGFIVWLSPFAHDQRQPTEQAKIHEVTVFRDANGTSETLVSGPDIRLEPVSPTRLSVVCGTGDTQLRVALEAAQKLSYTGPRDEALLSVSRSAICLDNLEVFEKAVSKMGYSKNKDTAYKEVINELLNAGKYGPAEKYANQLSYSSDRDSARSRILSRALGREGE